MTPSRPAMRTVSDAAMARQVRMSAAKLDLFDVRERHGLSVLEWLAVLGSEVEGCATAYRRDTEPDPTAEDAP